MNINSTLSQSGECTRSSTGVMAIVHRRNKSLKLRGEGVRGTLSNLTTKSQPRSLGINIFFHLAIAASILGMQMDLSTLLELQSLESFTAALSWCSWVEGVVYDAHHVAKFDLKPSPAMFNNLPRRVCSGPHKCAWRNCLDVSVDPQL